MDLATTSALPGCWRPGCPCLAAADSCSASTAAASARTAARPRLTPGKKLGLQIERATKAMRSHQLEVAALVPDKKLYHFLTRKKVFRLPETI